MGLLSFAGAVVGIAGLCAALLPASALAADTALYPNRPMRFVVPFPPSGTNDIIARALVPTLTDQHHHCGATAHQSRQIARVGGKRHAACFHRA